MNPPRPTPARVPTSVHAAVRGRVPRLLRRAGAVLALSAAAVLLAPGLASAHVSVQAPGAQQGSFAGLTFRVPNERDDASTTKVQVSFPTNQPLAFVSVKPHPGWSYQITKATLAKPVDIEGQQITQAVSQVTWTADSPTTAIKPGEYEEFSVSAGFLPKAEQMVFKALQTYSSGEVVRWIEPHSAGGAEPEHPAPVLALAKGTGSAHGGAPAGEEHPASHAAGGLSGWLGGAALVISLVALALAVSARRRQPPAATPARPAARKGERSPV